MTVLSWFCRGAAALDPRPRMRLGRKTSVSQLQGRPRACRDVRCEVPRQGGCQPRVRLRRRPERASSEGDAPLRLQLGPTGSAHGFGDTASCPFCPWLQL